MRVGLFWLTRLNETGKTSLWTRVTVYRTIIRNTCSLMALGLSQKNCRRSPVSCYDMEYFTRVWLTVTMIAVTQDELQRHISDFLAGLNVEMLVTGNMHKDVRISYWKKRVKLNLLTIGSHWFIRDGGECA